MSRAVDLPPMANWLDMGKYNPAYGDVVFWSGYFSNWVGVVTNYDPQRDVITIVFGGLPILLFTMEDAEQNKSTYKLPLDRLRRSRPGTFSVLQHDQSRNGNIWYV